MNISAVTPNQVSVTASILNYPFIAFDKHHTIFVFRKTSFIHIYQKLDTFKVLKFAGS